MAHRLKNFSLGRPLCLLVILLILWVKLNGADGFDALVDALGIALICCFTFSALLFSFGSDFLRFIPAAFTTVFKQAETPSNVNFEICRNGSRFAITFGVLWMAIALASMLHNLEDPYRIGASMGLALRTLAYGVLLSECIFRPLRYRFEPKSDTGNEIGNSKFDWKVTAVCLVAFWFVGSCAFLSLVLEASADRRPPNDEILLIRMPEIVIHNLNGYNSDADSQRHFRVDVAMSLSSVDMVRFLENEDNGMMDRIRGDMFEILTSTNSVQFTSRDRSNYLAQRMRQKLNQTFTSSKAPGTVTDVYFPSFILDEINPERN